MNIIFIGYSFWNNDVKQIKETEKAVLLKVEGDKRFIDCVGVQAWFPKSALETETIKDADGTELTTAQVKPWFRTKMNNNQARVVGTMGW